MNPFKMILAMSERPDPQNAVVGKNDENSFDAKLDGPRNSDTKWL